MKHHSAHITKTLLSLFFILPLFTCCGPGRYEKAVTGQLLDAEHTFFIDFDHGSSLFEAFDSVMSPETAHEKHLRTLLKYRLCDTWMLSPDTLDILIDYFSAHGDSLFTAIAYARRGDYRYEEQHSNNRAIQNYKQAQNWCPHNYSGLYARIIYSISRLYDINYPERKIKLLHEAIDIFGRDTNITYLGYCYSDMVMAQQDMDSARRYAELIVQPSFFIRLDTMAQMRIFALFAEKFAEDIGGDTIIALTEPLYTCCPTPQLSYSMALGHLKNGDTLAAAPYIGELRAEDGAEPLYHYLMFQKHKLSGNWRLALNEHILYDLNSEHIFRANSSKNIVALEKEVERQIARKHEEKQKIHTLTWIIITITATLLATIIMIMMYIFMKQRNRNLKIRHEKASTELVRQHDENILSLTKQFRALKDRNMPNIIKHIDIAAVNLSHALRDRHPQIKDKDIAILFFRHIGFSMTEISYYFGYTGIASVHSRLSRLKKELDIPADTNIMHWFNEEIRDIAPSLYKPDMSDIK